jgi:hypothetical protein
VFMLPPRLPRDASFAGATHTAQTGSRAGSRWPHNTPGPSASRAGSGLGRRTRSVSRRRGRGVTPLSRAGSRSRTAPGDAHAPHAPPTAGTGWLSRAASWLTGGRTRS